MTTRHFKKGSETRAYNCEGDIILATIEIGGRWVSNPTVQMLEADGWKEYIEPIKQRTLEDAKAERIAALEAFDSEESAEGVNWFYVGELGMWIKKADRSGLSLSINAAELSGKTSIALWAGDTRIDLPLATAKQMLCALELYATECYGVTASHRAAINALTTIKAVDAYDFKTGYPDKLHFDL